MSGTVTVTFGPSGPVPQTPASLLAQLLALVAATNPGYTANLPGVLIEDVSSTDVAAVALCDSAFVELINSVSPYGANEQILLQLGVNVYGAQPGLTTNTSVYVVFTGTPSFVVPAGFTVGDGQHQYVVQRGGVVGQAVGGPNGTTAPLFCVATQPGAWPVPAGSVTTVATALPEDIVLTVTNPANGTPQGTTETIETYRARVLQSGLVAVQGTPNFLRTLLTNVPGVDPRLVSIVLDQTINSWEVIVGGTGDPYQIANAILLGVPDVNALTGSTLLATTVTQANPGQVTTDLNHGFATGQVIKIHDATGMTAINGVNFTITVVDEKNFTLGVDTSGYPAYTGSGVVTPNFRNEVISLTYSPDTYAVPFVLPPAQTVGVTLLWNTDALNPVSSSNVNILGANALVAYINSIQVGLPINLFQLQAAFAQAVAGLLPTQFLSRMVFTVTINNIETAPDTGTGLIEGDPESYFVTNVSMMNISQG